MQMRRDTVERRRRRRKRSLWRKGRWGCILKSGRIIIVGVTPDRLSVRFNEKDGESRANRQRNGTFISSLAPFSPLMRTSSISIKKLPRFNSPRGRSGGSLSGSLKRSSKDSSLPSDRLSIYLFIYPAICLSIVRAFLEFFPSPRKFSTAAIDRISIMQFPCIQRVSRNHRSAAYPTEDSLGRFEAVGKYNISLRVR